MCRIAGIISKKPTKEELFGQMKIMCQTLAHGGPDDEGIYYSENDGLILGHRRLAIIDLTAGGHQPMPDARRKVWITFNGEIYNYPELRDQMMARGAVFTSGSDTEVILQAYLHWGIAAFSKLRGMFAFALYDQDRGQTFLVRDASGIKPLYYHADADGLCFASEVKALQRSGLVTLEDPDWPIRFLAFGHIPEPYTTLKNVFALPKSHFLKWDHTRHSHEVLAFGPDFRQQPPISSAVEAKSAVRRSLNETVGRQLLADAPIGVFLSGGIDSSLITLLAHRTKKEQLKTISICFDEQTFNEEVFQNLIVEQTDGLHDRYLVKQSDFEVELPAILAAMDMPTIDGINSWFISKYARVSGLKTVLSGLGGDELFGGYPSFRNIRYLKYLKWFPAPLLRLVAALSVGRIKRVALLTYRHPLADYLFLRGLFVPADIARILHMSESRVTGVLFADPLDLGHLSASQQAAWFEANLYMQNQLLRDTDVMSMAQGLEVRVPFLDEDFMQTVGRIEPAIRFDQAKPKKLLVEAFDGLLPRAVWDRRKMGFSFPLQQWMQDHPRIGDLDAYQGRETKKMIRRFKNSRVHWSRAYALYQLQTFSPVTTAPQEKKVLLLTLQTFSATGGIQKMGRTMAHVLQQIAQNRHWKFSLWSGYDRQSDLDPLDARASNFRGFQKKRARFAAKAILEGLRSDTIILSHINLAAIGWLIKMIKPGCQVWLVAHGIEVWRPLSLVKKRLLLKCDKIICVSHFTRQKMIALHGADVRKCVVVNNALDASIKPPVIFDKPDYLLRRYHIEPGSPVIYTLTRLASTEKYKGYEQVIKAVSRLKDRYPAIKYILSGSYDELEDIHIRQLVIDHGVQDQVIITGFIEEPELEDHFLLADMFVLPSKKEGFGIVFIEALACGLPVICGNEDGSLDAIRNGELGVAINADDVAELEQAIVRYLEVPRTAQRRRDLQAKCLQYFNTGDYQNTLDKLLSA